MGDMPPSHSISKAWVVMLLSVVIGIGSRRFGGWLPDFLGNYLGDTMWALCFFALFRLLFSPKKLWEIFLITLSFAYLVELSQLWHPLWLDKIRNTLPGGLLLGFGFRSSDLLCYLAGCLMGWLVFWLGKAGWKRHPDACN